MGQVFRISTAAGTIPAATTLSGGTVTTDTNDTTTLIYTGTDNLLTILPDTLTGAKGCAWIYIVGSSTKLARVLGITAVDETNDAALVYAILLDRAMAGNSGATATYVIADLKSYEVQNTTSTDGVFDGVAMGGDTVIKEAIQYPLNTGWLEAKTFNATGTSFLLIENK